MPAGGVRKRLCVQISIICVSRLTHAAKDILSIVTDIMSIMTVRPLAALLGIYYHLSVIRSYSPIDGIHPVTYIRAGAGVRSAESEGVSRSHRVVWAAGP